MTPTRLTYVMTPGPGAEYLVLACPPTLVIVDTRSNEHVEAIWELLRSERSGQQGVLEYAMSVGLRSFPTLVIAQAEPHSGSVELILRGSATVATRRSGMAEERHTGEGARTWRAVTVEGVQVLSVGDPAGSRGLPLDAGVVGAGGLVLSLIHI